GSSRQVLQLRPAGTPAYMAPEQKTPGGKLGPATDIYLLAASLWDLLIGQPFREGVSGQDGIQAEKKRVLSLLLRGLTADPGSRPQNALAFHVMLENEHRFLMGA